ncbi:MAG: UDP-N-acetylmuramate dehydrogenase [Phaeodactylibacter sp.]|nr:UDP-N-acetylmuramate dehydrogenase [Phaeodactylibacter sp.]MCB9275863.1 UDP-N-acetylmuramate dehydrogenase [Lewinellaceae bacterium]
MDIQENVSLRHLNTFGIDARAQYYTEIHSSAELQETLRHWKGSTPFVLGGGSNILFTGDVGRLVIRNRIKGREAVRRQAGKAWVAAGGGENWHEFVLWCLDEGLGGIENLSLIPGTVGAAPIQNIGAYGVELRDVFHSLEAIELSTGMEHAFGREACQFGYRDSVFKGPFRGHYCITRVVFELTTGPHQIHSSYGAIKEILAARGITDPTIRDISEAVIAIRSSKLPNPVQIGNAGSFFKNPEIPQQQFDGLLERFPDIVHYPAGEGLVKVPAGWLIEQCGWKGQRFGDAGCYEKQALVLVNYGQASGKDILQLAQKIVDSVDEKFGVRLMPEVNVV